MAVAAGIDEAGYGPLMGPYVVSSTAFRVPDERIDEDLWALFNPFVCRKASRKDSRLCVGDSKAVFKRAAGLSSLENHLLPFVALLENVPLTLGKLVSALSARDLGDLSDYPWYRGQNPSLPREATTEQLRDRAATLADGLADAESAFCSARFEWLDVATFNHRVAARRNKASVAAGCVGLLMLDLWERFGRELLVLSVDKQGGRNRYGDFLSSLFPFHHIKTSAEGADHSRYVVAEGDRQMIVTFEKQADQRQLPAALASMLSKYVREVFLGLLNDFWAKRVTHLQPTAGYVTDGRRFLDDIDAIRHAEAIPLGLLARCR